MKTRRKRKICLELSSSSPEARKRAVAILEVMGGLSSPTTAAQAVGMSLPRYYALEKRALEGMVMACAPSLRKGNQVSPTREMEKLRERVKFLEREVARNLAMFRAAQRAVGLTIQTTRNGKNAEKTSNRKNRRKPVIRALTVAESLREKTIADPPVVSNVM